MGYTYPHKEKLHSKAHYVFYADSDAAVINLARMPFLNISML